MNNDKKFINISSLCGIGPDVETSLNKMINTNALEFFIPRRKGNAGYYVSDFQTIEIPGGTTVNTVTAWVAAVDYWFLHENGDRKERPLGHIRFCPDLEDIPNTRKCKVRIEAHLSDEDGDDYWQGWVAVVVMCTYE